jgi:hypothetical protein
MLAAKQDITTQISTLVALCQQCAQACAESVEACSRSGLSDTFRQCDTLCSDCADICRTTAQVAQRFAGGDAKALAALVRVCAKACGDCATECDSHDLEATRQCVRACLDCKQACDRLANALRWR